VSQVFSTGNLPSDPAGWPKFRKIAVTSAMKVTGPFTVETSEGPLTCADGYLAVDARSYPYPIATDEFELIYRPDGTP
jgi:hypothetical protein